MYVEIPFQKMPKYIGIFRNIYTHTYKNIYVAIVCRRLAAANVYEILIVNSMVLNLLGGLHY